MDLLVFFNVSLDTSAIRRCLNFSSLSIFSEARRPLFFGGCGTVRGEKSAPCSQSEGSCQAGPL